MLTPRFEVSNFQIPSKLQSLCNKFKNLILSVTISTPCSAPGSPHHH